MPTGTVQVPVHSGSRAEAPAGAEAKDAKLTMGELLRQGGERFAPRSPGPEVVASRLPGELARTAQRAIQSIDKTLALVAQSKRIRPWQTRHEKKH